MQRSVQDDRSVNHYLQNPEGYSRLLEKSADILEKRIKSLKDEQERREKVAELERYLRDNLLPRLDFEKDDSLLWRPDTLAVDSLAVDSLLVDSLAVDSLAVDSLVVVDTLAAEIIKDSIIHAKGRDRIRANSLKEAR